MDGTYEIKKSLLLTELDRLQRMTDHMHNFDVMWAPNPYSKIEGKVEGNTITIYSPDINGAISTLQHEFVDYVVSQAINPYIKLVNSLMSVITKQAYTTKERSVESLLKLTN